MIFFIPLAFDAPLGGPRRDIAIPFSVQKLEWWGYRTVKKNFEDMCNRLHTIPVCDGRTDRQTPGQTSCDGIVRAMHTRRAIKKIRRLIQ